MAGIQVPQYDIFKIGTKKLKYHNWDLQITKDEAFQCNEIVSLFEAQEFRLIAQILKTPIKKISFENYLLIVCIDSPKDFSKAMRKKGITVNGITFKRFIGTTSGLKKNTVIFANAEILDELNRRCNCGRKEIEIVPAKLEAYKALTCSASQPIPDPQGIIVVPDCVTHITEDIIKLDDTGDDIEPNMTILKDEPLENDVSDGFSLCTIGYMQRISEALGLDYVAGGVCLRNAWVKGMLYAFPIYEFIEKYNNGNYIIKDIWGNDKDLREAELILTESCLKLWSAYDSIEDYIKAYHKNGYTFAVTKISPKELEDEREINYQYLQSYDFTDEDIEKLCAPTVKYLKDACCGDYASTIRFLGIVDSQEENTWQHALRICPKMLHDPHIIDNVHHMIQNTINEAKLGRLLVNGNYQICSGDPFALMQSICGLEVTGLLKAKQIYSKYWSDKQVTEVVVFRSPMTSHNNIRKCEVINSEEMTYWYQYMDTIMILNGFDTMCQALNGCDYDGDILFSTNNEVLLNKHRETLPIICIQKSAVKKIPKEEDLVKVCVDGMGNKVGTITNRVTAMMEVQSHFSPDSKEYKELEYRIISGQLYQQAEIDHLKGIISKPMPKYWYNYFACEGDSFLQSICVEKKPYFMTYIYSDYRHSHNDYLKQTKQSIALDFEEKYEDFHENFTETEEKTKFLSYFNSKYPFGNGPCAMNRICWHIEKEFKDIVYQVKKAGDFDYHFLKTEDEPRNKVLKSLEELYKEYLSLLKQMNAWHQSHSTDGIVKISIRKKDIRKHFYNKARQICKNEDILTNAIIELCYHNKCNYQFMWDCVGKNIIQRLEDQIYGNK